MDLQSASALRKEIGLLIQRFAQPGDDIAAAELIIGEVIGNVARHAPGPMCVDLDWRDAEPTLVVHDSGPGIDRDFSLQPPANKESGRGLNLIAALARRLSVERGEFGGTRVAATLPVTRSLSDEPFVEACPNNWPYRFGRSCLPM